MADVEMESSNVGEVAAKEEEKAVEVEEKPQETETAEEVHEDAEHNGVNGAEHIEEGMDSTNTEAKPAGMTFKKQELVDNFCEKKLSQKVATRLADVIVDLGLAAEDFDERAVDLLSTFSQEQSMFIIKEIEESQLFGVQNRAQYLMAIMRNFKERLRTMGAGSISVPLIPGPQVKSIKDIVDRTNYLLEITVGQRKYHCPPEMINKPTGGDHELYIGQIPKDVYEDGLIPLFEEVGQIWDLRIMMDPVNGKNRGYGFLIYANRDHALEAAKKFNGYEIQPGKPLKVNVSVANTRLFIGNIPKSKSKEEILEELRKHAEGVDDVIVYINPDAQDNKKNRGFCFVDFIDHKSASDAKRRISIGKARPWNSDLVVDWAEQQEEPDEETMSQVKVVYVKNLKESVSEERLNEIFAEYGEIERTKKIRDYAFVHYKDRECALKAVQDMKGKEIDGIDVDVSLAKPQVDNKQKKKPMPNQKRPFNGGRGGRDGDYYGGPPGRGGDYGYAGPVGRGRGGPQAAYQKYPSYPAGYNYPPDPYSNYGGGYSAPYGGYSADPYGYGYEPQVYSGPYTGPARGGNFNRGPNRGGRGSFGGRGAPRGNRGGNRGAKRPGEQSFGAPPSKRMDFSSDVQANNF